MWCTYWLTPRRLRLTLTKNWTVTSSIKRFDLYRNHKSALRGVVCRRVKSDCKKLKWRPVRHSCQCLYLTDVVRLDGRDTGWEGKGSSPTQAVEPAGVAPLLLAQVPRPRSPSPGGIALGDVIPTRVWDCWQGRGTGSNWNTDAGPAMRAMWTTETSERRPVGA